MPLQASCPRCNARHNLNDGLAGKTIRCKHCRQPFAVGVQGERRPRPAAPPTPGGRGRAGQKSKRALVLGLSLAGALLVAAVAVWLTVLLISDKVDRNVQDLKTGSAEARQQALVWLAQADPQDADRPQVTAALEPLIFGGGIGRAPSLDLVLRTYLHWADKTNVPAMIRMVENPSLPSWDAGKTALVMAALGKLQDDRAVGALADKLGDPALHDQAVDALGVLGPAAEKGLLDYLFTDDPAVRLRASRLLADYGTKPEMVTAEALSRLKANDAEVRRGAAVWFADNAPTDESARAEASRLLAPLLEDLSPKVSGPALQALKAWGTRDCLPQLLEYARRAEKAGSCSPALIDVLAQFPEAAAAEAVALQLPNPTLRGQAAQALLKLGPVATRAVLRYLDDPDDIIREEARDLCRLLNVAADQQLDQMLADVADPEVARCRVALESLARLRPDEVSRAKVSRALNAPLLDPNPGIRADALNAVKVWGSKENTVTLLKILGDVQGRGPGRSGGVIDLLGSLEDPAAAPALAQGLTHRSERGWVSRALKSIGPGAEPAVLPFLQSSDEGARIEACRILAEVGTAQSLPPLQAAAERYFTDGTFNQEVELASQKIAARF